jgi:nitrilase
MMADTLLAAAIQMCSGDDLQHNLARAAQLVGEAAQAAARFVALPEYFYLMPADEQARLPLAEAFGNGPLQAQMASLARQYGIWLLAGTLPLQSGDATFSQQQPAVLPDGQCVARYDKMHLFGFRHGDEHYAEADTMQAGDQPISADTPWGSLRLSVCYDLRFPELYRQPPLRA